MKQPKIIRSAIQYSFLLSVIALGFITITASGGGGGDGSASTTTPEQPTLTTYYLDADGDGYGDINNPIEDETRPSGYVAGSNDCDDSDPEIHPKATEVCDGVDNDCDGEINEGFNDSCQKVTYYLDADGDGYGDSNQTKEDYTQLAGYVLNGNDCDDSDADVNPSATEICDGLDNNCSDVIDEGCASPQPRFTDLKDGTIRDNKTGLIWMKNAAALGKDSWFDSMYKIAFLSSGEYGLTDNSVDGDWRLPTIDEWAAFVDDSYNDPALCNTQGDAQWTEGDAFIGVGIGFSTYYWSSTMNNDASKARVIAIRTGSTALVNEITPPHTDSIWPVHSTEVAPLTTYYLDSDEDGFGDINESIVDTDKPSGYVSNGVDCDDTDPDIHPEATEICNDVDDNCNSEIDEGFNELCQNVVVLQAVEDSYVDSLYSTANYGSGSGLKTGEEIDDSSGSVSYLSTFVKFDLSSIPTDATIVSASLNLKTIFYVSSFSATITIYQVSGTNWSEDSLNYNNMPGGSLQSVSESFDDINNESKNFDILSFVTSWHAATPNYGVKIDSDITSSDFTSCVFYSREDGYPPLLTIVYE